MKNAHENMKFREFLTGGYPHSLGMILEDEDGGIELFANEKADKFMLADSYRSDYGRWDSDLGWIVWDEGYFIYPLRISASQKAEAYRKGKGI